MRKIKVYLEGGANGAARVALRKAMQTFLSRGTGSANRIQVITCGPRSETYKLFCKALAEDRRAPLCLLVDSEGPVQQEGRCWAHLGRQQKDLWKRPAGTRDDQCHLMVQAMEAWLIADPDAIKAVFHTTQHAGALPKTLVVEEIDKEQHVKILDRVLRSTRRSRYDKASDAPAILEKLDPKIVADRAPHCRRLLETLRDMLNKSDV